MIRFVLLFGLILLLTSCQSAKELHYFKEGNNYYRLRIKEKAWLSSSRYLSGYFEEASVDRYFGELRRPDSTKLVTVIEPSDGENTNPRDKNNSKLVLILSTNSEAIAEQISALSKNEETLELIARLANKDIIEKKSQNEQLHATLSHELSKELDLTELFIGSIDDNRVDTEQEYLKTVILDYLNFLATSRGLTKSFTTIDEAEIWFQSTFME